MPKNSLHKAERIKSRKLIASLFETGQKVHHGPLLLIWLPIETDSTPPLKFGVSVSKRKFRRAVDRNLIKRRMREAYRLYKNEIISKLDSPDKAYALFVVYVGHAIEEFDVIKPAMEKLMDKWVKRLPEGEKVRT